ALRLGRAGRTELQLRQADSTAAECARRAVVVGRALSATCSRTSARTRRLLDRRAGAARAGGREGGNPVLTGRRTALRRRIRAAIAVRAVASSTALRAVGVASGARAMRISGHRTARA